MATYDAPYLSEEEHSELDHTGVPGVGGGSSDLTNYSGLNVKVTSTEDSGSGIELVAEGAFTAVTVTAVEEGGGMIFQAAQAFGVSIVEPGGVISLSTAGGSAIQATDDDVIFTDPVGELTLNQIRAGLGGGGGAPDEHLSISGDGGGIIDSGTFTAYPLSPTANGGAGFVQRGTNLTWSAGNPTRVTVNADGVYDVSVGVGFVTSSTNFPISLGADVFINGTQSPILGFMGQSTPVYSNSTLKVISWSFNGIAMADGDFFEVSPFGSDLVAGDGVATVIYAYLSVTQRI